jgi:ferritin
MIGKYNQFEQKQKPVQMSKPLNEAAVTVGGKVVTPKTLPVKVYDMVNERLRDEYAAHYFYRNAANWCNDKNYKKAAAFFEAEANAELEHAKGLQDYITQWNMMPEIPSAPTKVSFESLIEIVNGAYEIEYDLFEKYSGNQLEVFDQHPATFNFLQKYVTMQNESVAEFSDLLNALELIDINNRLDVLFFETKYFKQ